MRRFFSSFCGMGIIGLFFAWPASSWAYTTNMNASVVVGQANFTSGSANQGGSLAANTLNVAYDVIAYDDKLLVTDFSNNRVLIYNNIINTPALGIEEPVGSTNGKLRINGTISVSDGNYGIWKVEASVNGGSYGTVSNLTPGIHIVGSTKPVMGTFFHDFEPWSQDNGIKQDWEIKQPEMLREKGYTIKFQGYNTNTDKAEHLFFFQPFTISLPITMSTSPTLSFSVNAHQRREMREQVDHYELWVRSLSGDETLTLWQKYITDIPADFDIVRTREDNMRTDTLYDPGSGNGTYENQDLWVTFSNHSSTIHVRKKGSQSGTRSPLSPGVYQIKVSAIDKHQHTQDSNVVTVTIKGSPNNTKHLPMTTEWFPLQINTITTANTGFLSSFNPSLVQDTYTTTTYYPLIHGIAFTRTKIFLTITDAETEAERRYETTAQDSSFSFAPTLFSTSLLDLSAEDSNGRYTELPTFILQVN